VPSCHRGPVCPMIGESANSQKMLLAAAIAEGTAVAKWASSNEVPERTAHRWAAAPEVRSEIESIRRRALDEAIGRLAKRGLHVAFPTRSVASYVIRGGGAHICHESSARGCQTQADSIDIRP
jgi:hypothetical protein